MAHSDTTASDTATSASAPTRERWVWQPWVHAVAVAVVLLAGIFVVDNGQVAMVDEAVYLGQAQNLSNGSWASERPAVDIDPDGSYTALQSSGVSGDKVVPYPKHPLYPLVLTPFFALGGVAGGLVLSVLGTAIAALAAGLIARRIDPRLGPWAVWIVGIGSPLFFDSYLNIAHTLGAAGAGLAFLGVSQAIDDRRLAPLGYALPAIAVSVGLRSEGLVAAGAIALVVGVTALGWPPLRRIDWRSGWIAASVLATAGVAHVAEGLASQRLFDGLVSSFDPVQFAGRPSINPLEGIWPTLLRPGYGFDFQLNPVTPVVALTIVVAALAIKVAPSRLLVPLVMLVIAAGASIGVALSAPMLITGLLAAFPILPAGLILLHRRDLSDPLVGRALAVGLVGSVVVLAANYGTGGEAEWGGRFLHVFLPILVPVALVGLRNAMAVLPRTERILAGGCIGVVLLSMSVTMVRVHLELRKAVADFTQSTVEVALAETALHPDDPALVVVSPRQNDGSSRYFWNTRDTLDVLRPENPILVNKLFQAAVEQGREHIVVVTTRSTRADAIADFDIGLDDFGLQIDAVTQSPDNTATILTLGPIDPDR